MCQASPKFKVSTLIKNFVLTKRPYAEEAAEYGFEMYTDPETVAEGFLAMHGEKEFSTILDKALVGKPDMRLLAKEFFGV